MMEDHEFCDSCPGCRPALLDANTGKRLTNDDPMMLIVNNIWDKDTAFAQRRAFIEVTLKNSTNPRDLELCQQVISKIENALQKYDEDVT